MKKTTYQLLLHLAGYSCIGILSQLSVISLCLAHEAEAQRVKSVHEVTIETAYQNVSLAEVFSDIEAKTDFEFTYDRKDTFLKDRFSNTARRTTVGDLLKDISLTSRLIFQQINNNISIKRQAKEEEDKPVIIIKTAINVSGKVTSQVDGAGIPGVNVIVKGSGNGTVTDIDGNYSLSVADENGTLIFSSIGFTTQEVAINGRSVIDLALSEDVQSLEEIVVIGYGTQKQREVTGSIATLEAEQLEDQPVGQVAQRIQGRIPGVQINQASGTPGAGMAIRIRGAASINAGNSPLFVVDGFPIVGDINNINPNEIESFSVLKGASAAALYGSRAANGVVLITTKRARNGQTSIQFNATYGMARVPQKGRADMMNAQEFLQYKKEFFEDKIKYEGYTGGIPEEYQNPEGYTGKNTDWYDELLQTGIQNSYNLSFLAGKEKFNTATTLGYYKEDGTVINSGYKRYSLRSNNEYQVNDFIRVGINVAPTFQNSENQQTGGTHGSNYLYGALITPAIFSPDDTNEDGTQKVNFTAPSLFTFPNWKRSMAERTNIASATRLLSNAYAEVDFLKNFSFKSSVSIDLENKKERYFNPSTAGDIFAPPPKMATASYTTTDYSSWLTENTLNFNKTLDETHQIDALVGYSAQKYREEYNRLTGTDFPDDVITWIDAAAIKNGSSNVTEWSLLSMFSRLNYNYKGKYLFSASIRRDGSSRFGSDNRWGTFPSVSAGWIISDEGFATNWLTLSYLKLRAEYGESGNFNIGNYSQFGNIASTNYVFGDQLVQGQSPNSIGNSRLTWETTRGFDIGLDLGLFDDRVSLTFDYYDKTTSDMLYQVDIPNGTGYSNIQDNIGEFHFWGYEFGASSINFVGDFQWNTDFNVSINRNEVMQLGTNNTPIGGIGNYSNTIWRTEVGRPIGQFYGYVFDGIYMTQEEFDSQPKHLTSAVGTMRMKDINNDGVINTDDKTYIGNPNAKFLFGINNSFKYKNFDLNIVMTGSYGGKMYYALAEWSETLEGAFNVERHVINRWRSPEDPGDGIVGRTLSGTTEFPRNVQSRLVLDASYLTVKNITLGYTLPKFSEFVNRTRIYASIQQALVLTKYKGSSPEASLNELNGLQEGVDFNPYPVPRTIALGLNLNF
ncbi:MAG: TonB-dependent receptor [Cyclobacteriaceae bacterium]